MEIEEFAQNRMVDLVSQGHFRAMLLVCYSKGSIHSAIVVEDFFNLGLPDLLLIIASGRICGVSGPDLPDAAIVYRPLALNTGRSLVLGGVIKFAPNKAPTYARYTSERTGVGKYALAYREESVLPSGELIPVFDTMDPFTAKAGLDVEKIPADEYFPRAIELIEYTQVSMFMRAQFNYGFKLGGGPST